MSYSPLLTLHICGGIVGLLSGSVALSLRKGSRGHQVAGNVFFVSMLIMSAVGAYLAAVKSQMSNVFGGVLTFYLVATAWATVRRREGSGGVFDWAALMLALASGTGMAAFGYQAAHSASGQKGDGPAGMYFFLATVTLLAAAGDIRMLWRGGVSGVSRIARHLWRMCFALFIASGSVFLARAHLFPSLLRKAHVLTLLAVLPLLLMIFWLFRVRFRRSAPA